MSVRCHVTCHACGWRSPFAERSIVIQLADLHRRKVHGGDDFQYVEVRRGDPLYEEPENAGPTDPGGMFCCYCSKPGDLRPYGPKGAPICFDCMKATPEREEEATRQFLGKGA